ncbi:MAG: hypothetical protein LBI01_05970 [Elusimicrobium sp.]|nr:hypothetical protein [Elusimicrobium sp.]
MRNKFNTVEDAAAAHYTCCSPCTVSSSWVSGTCPYTDYDQSVLAPGVTKTYCYATQAGAVSAGNSVIGVQTNASSSLTPQCPASTGNVGKNCNNVSYCTVGSTVLNWWSVVMGDAVPATDRQAVCNWALANNQLTSDGYANCYYLCAIQGCSATGNFRVKCNLSYQYKTIQCTGW